jgi:ATP/maltotriose-dependent transcriptional regulator MalT
VSVLRGEHVTLLNWISALPQSLVRQRPEIRLSYIWSLIHTYRYADAEKEFSSLEVYIEVASVASAGKKHEAMLDTVMRKCMMMRCVFDVFSARAQHAGITSLEWLGRWVHKADASEVGTVLNTFGYSAYIAHDYEKALNAFVNAKKKHEFGGSYNGLAWSEALHALVVLEQGDVHSAEHILTAAQKALSERLGQQSFGRSILAMLQAQVLYEKNRVDEANHTLDKAFLFVNGPIFSDSFSRAYLIKARILWLRGQCDEADACLAEVALAGVRLGLERLALIASAERIHLHLRNQRTKDAFRIASSIGLLEEDGIKSNGADIWRDSIGLRLVEIRLQIAGGHTKRT